MPAFQDLSDQRFGRLLVIERGPNQGTRTRWRVRCDCGEERLVQANHLTSGRQVSCGCSRNEKSRQSKNIKHGFYTAERLATKQGRKAASLWSDFRLSYNKYEAMIDRQQGVCAICGSIPEIWNVDHDHSCCLSKPTCGRCVRGLLCTPCNQGLGMFVDMPARLRSAAIYLDGWLPQHLSSGTSTA